MKLVIALVIYVGYEPWILGILCIEMWHLTKVTRTMMNDTPYEKGDVDRTCSKHLVFDIMITMIMI